MCGCCFPSAFSVFLGGFLLLVVLSSSSFGWLLLLLRGGYSGGGGCVQNQKRRQDARLKTEFTSKGNQCPLSIRHPPRYSNHAIDGFCVPSVLRFQSPNFTSSEHAICIPNETLPSQAELRTDIWGSSRSSDPW